MLLNREGCLIETCNDGFVQESFSTACLEIIEKIIEDKLEKTLTEKGVLSVIRCVICHLRFLF